MKLEEIMMKLFDFSRPTYFKKRREEVPVMFLLEEYFTKEELEEFLEKDKIKKFELIKNMSYDDLNLIINKSNNQPIEVPQINRILYTAFKRRSLSYLYYLIKHHNITDSTSLKNYNIEKDKENTFITFFKEWNHDWDANVVTFSFNRKEFNEFAELYLTENEIDFIFRNQKIFAASLKKILEHKLKKGV